MTENKPETSRKSLKDLLSKPNLILLSIPVLVVLQIRFGSASAFDFFFARFLGDSAVSSILRILYQDLSVFLLLGLVPLLIIGLGFKEKPSEYGLKTGDSRFGYTVVLVSLIPGAVGMILSAAVPNAKPPSFLDVYPFIPAVSGSAGLFLLNIGFLAVFYAGFEFFYRGYILFGLKNSFGSVAAVLIQAVPSVLIHFDKPDAEFLISIPGEIFLGWLALRTGSVWYGFLIHLFLGITMELACVAFR